MNNLIILRVTISFWLFIGAGSTMVFAQDLIPTLKDGLFGFANPSGEVIIEHQFDKAFFFGHQLGPEKSTTHGDRMTADLAIVYKDSAYNLVTRTGDFLLERGLRHKPRIRTRTLLNPYRQKEELRETLRRSAVNVIHVKKQQTHFFGYYFPTTKIFTDLIYSEKKGRQEYRVKQGVVFSDSIAGELKMLIVAPLKKGQYDLLDENGNKLLSDVKNIRVFDRGYFAWLDKEMSWHYSHVLDGELFNGRYDKILKKQLNKNNPFIKITKYSLGRGDYIGLMRMDGAEIMATKYRKIEIFPKVIIASLFKNANGIDLELRPIIEYQILDLKGNILKSFEHPIQRIDETNFLLKGDSTQHIINLEGDTLFSTRTNRLEIRENRADTSKYFYYQTDKFSGLMDLTFKPIFQYEGKVSISPFERNKKLEEVNYFTTSVSTKNGLLTKKGEEFFPPLYQKIEKTQGDYFLLKLSWDLMGLANSSGEMIFDPIYKNISVSIFEDLPYFKLQKEKFYTCLDQNLDSLSGFESTKSYVGRDPVHAEYIEGKFALFNRFGKRLTPFKYDKVKLKDIIVEGIHYTSAYRSDSSSMDLYTSEGKLYKSNLDSTEINSLKALPNYAKENIEIYAKSWDNFLVRKKQKDGSYLYGMLGEKGNWLVPLIYDRASNDFFDDEAWFSRIENGERISYMAEDDGEMTRIGNYDKIYLQEYSYIGIRQGKPYIIDEDEVNVERLLSIKKTSFGESIYYYKLDKSKPTLVWAKERSRKRLPSENMLGTELRELPRLGKDRFLFYLDEKLYLLNNRAEVLEEFDMDKKPEKFPYHNIIIHNTPLIKIRVGDVEYYYNYKTLTSFKQ